MVTTDHVIIMYVPSGNMEQERLQLMMKCERLSSHRRRLEAALQFCHSHSLVRSSGDCAPTGAPPTQQQQLHRKLSKATQVIIDLVNQKEQLLSVVNTLRDKLKSSERKLENSSSNDIGSHNVRSHDAKLHDDGSHDHKHTVTTNVTTPVKNHVHDSQNKVIHHSTPLCHSYHDSSNTRTPSIGNYHGNSHDKQMTSAESLQVTDSFELSCQQHHEALEKLLSAAAADNLLSSEDDHVPSNKMVVKGKGLGHPPVGVHKSRNHVKRPPRRSKKPQH